MGAVLFDGVRVFAFRPKWYDVPTIIVCITPFFSSITNGLGVYDGLSQVFGACTTWGVPYLLARVYYSDVAGSRDLAFVILIGCLVYVPLCLIEVRLSPQLNLWLYGYHQHSFAQSKQRFG